MELTKDEIREQLASMGTLQLRAYEKAEARWTFCKTEIEPNILEACGDPDSVKTGLLPNHEFLIRSWETLLAVEKCRKIAHSWAVALKALARSATEPYSTTIIQSIDEREAKEKNNFLERQYKALRPAKQRELRMSDGQDMRKFANGARIEFIARKAATGAGASFELDEFSVDPGRGVTPGEILIAALGAITHSGSVSIGGTQRGPKTLFNTIIKGQSQELEMDDPLSSLLPDLKWKVKSFPWWTSPALCVNVEEATRLAPAMETYDRVVKYGNEKLKSQFVYYTKTPTLGLEMFQREFECKVLDDNESYYSIDLCKQCYFDKHEFYDFCEVKGNQYEKNGTLALNEMKNKILAIKRMIDAGILEGEWCFGYDIGRFHDRDEIVLGNSDAKNRQKVNVRMVIGGEKLPFPAKREIITFLMDALPIVRGLIDATRGSMGTELAEWAEKTYGQRAAGLMFTTSNKQILASEMRARMEGFLFGMPHPEDGKGFRRLYEQFIEVKKYQSDSGTITFDVERNDTQHGDAFWACTLFNHCYGLPNYYRARPSVAMQQQAQNVGLNNLHGGSVGSRVILPRNFPHAGGGLAGGIGNRRRF